MPSARDKPETPLLLTEAARRLAQSLDYDETIDTVADIVVPSFADACGIYVIEGQAIRSIIKHGNSIRPEFIRQRRTRFEIRLTSSHPVAEVIRTGRVMALNEADPMQPFAAGERPNFAGQPSISSLILPLKARDRIIGALSLMHTAESGQRFRRAERKLLEELMDFIAPAIGNAMLYQRAREAMRVRDALLLAAGYDLKGPSTAIALETARLKRRATRSTRLMEIAITRITDQAEELMDIARLQQGESLRLQREPTNLVGVVRELVGSMSALDQAVHVVIEREASAITGNWDRLRLRRAIAKILDNALKYSDSEPGVEVRVTVDWSNKSLVLSVQDAGTGIPAQELADILERFYRTADQTRQGDALALATVKHVVEAHGGRIEVESQEGRGTLFSLRLPLEEVPQPPPSESTANAD